MAQTVLQVVEAGTVALAALLGILVAETAPPVVAGVVVLAAPLGIVVAPVLPGKLELAVQPVAAVAQIAETGML